MTDREEAAGLFGPSSVSWRVDRELIVLTGGSCTLLMQAAHPIVAAGVIEHSTYASDPVGRLRRTLESSFDVVFGTLSTADAAIRRVNAIHACVGGRLPDGRAYAATDPEALLWVHATLVDTALRVYTRFVAPLDPDEVQAYHAESAQVAERLGVPRHILPPTIGELKEWMAARMADGTVRVTPQARRIARSVLRPLRVVPGALQDVAHLVSLATLDPSLRRQYGISWPPARERGIERLATLSRRALPFVPSPLRHAPRARAADRRMRQALGSAT